MPRVDFYVLADSVSAPRFICGIAQKARQQNLKSFILTQSQEDARSLDDLLWTFRDISFIPHRLADDQDADDVPVTVGWSGCVPAPGEVLINLTHEVPEFAVDFERVVETAGASAPQREQARERYRRYRDLGFELHSHNIDGNGDHAT